MPDYDFKAQRLFVEADLRAGSVLPASPEQANYLGNVLRLSDGAGLLLFNGRDGEWLARVERPSKKRVDLVPVERVREQTPPPDLRYLFAPLKAARLDYMVQKAVEMGAGVLEPVMTQHTQNPRLNVERMRANAVEAAEQCGILSVPQCRPLAKLGPVLEEWDGSRRLFFCDEREDCASPAALLAPFAGAPLALLVGPEGGFSGEERALLRSCDFVTPISLGPRILRADTAAVAALALIQAIAGDAR
ncbi:16S rRNA (uracil(1498)-N(3))-methyltransferase [Aureimonas populi]|uniref:Ribosomal RNA small subunit methyltransferase E n=1 Tax=Aureimonas populi TaxID=1701758 RepID=A0ABW5CL46_9HYPH|nr:16S rRNA (uracil(1498)-N(3))-methyltransferase [Aureimonas populi]